MTLKGQTRDPNTLKAQYLENYLSERLQIWFAALYRECLAGARIILPENGGGLGHVAPTISIDFVGVPWPAPNIGRFPHTTLEKLVNKFIGSIAVFLPRDAL